MGANSEPLWYARGTWLNILKCFHNSSLFDNSENIAVSMAIKVTARDVRVTQRMLCLNVAFAAQIYMSRRKVFLFASKQQLVALHWHNLPFYKAVNYVM